MFYSSKSIKINYFCRKLFDHTYRALDKEKTILSNLYLEQVFGLGAANNLARFTFNDLFIEIIEKIQTKKVDEILEIKQTILKTERILMLKKIIILNEPIRANLSFRVSNRIMEDIKKIKEQTSLKTYDVCELAIMDYVNNLDSIAFEVLLITLNEEFEERR